MIGRQLTSFGVLLLSVSLLLQCKAPDESIHVTGHLTNGVQPVSSAKVDLDGLVQYEVVTNEEGYFEISNVTPGRHDLNIQRTLGNDSFSKKTEVIEVSQSLQLNSLILPEPVQLLDPLIEQNLTEDKVTLRWTKYTGDDYREYKIYRRATPGLDETTGELIYVGTSASDTTFITMLPHSSQMYYRVFVLSETSLLAGSNLRNATTTSFINNPEIEIGVEKVFFLNAGETIWLYFNSEQREIYSISWFDANFEKKNYSAGRILASAWNESKSVKYFEWGFCGASWPVRSPISEKVFIKVEGYSNSISGTFAVHIQKLARESATLLTPNNLSVKVPLDPGEVKLFAFDATEGMEYVLQTGNTKNSGATGNAAYTTVSVYGQGEIFGEGENSPFIYMGAIPVPQEAPRQWTISVLKPERVYLVLGADDGPSWVTPNEVEVSVTAVKR